MYLDANVTSTASARQSDAVAERGTADKAVGRKITAKPSITTGLTTTPFGAMASSFAMRDIDFVAKGSKISIDASVEGTFQWGTNSGGIIDVPSATDAVVTADTYEQIVADLTPSLIEKSWRAPRSQYWSEAICQRHEKYHATDASKWTTSKAAGVVKTYLKKNPIELTDDERKDATVVKSKVEAALEEARKAVVAGRVFYFRGNITSYLSYPGEARAFGDGKVPYQKLSKAVAKQGKKLVAEKAKAEKAAAATPAPTTADSPDSPDSI